MKKVFVFFLIIYTILGFSLITESEAVNNLKKVEYSGQKNLYINAGNVDLSFKNDSSGIYVHKDFEVKTIKDDIFIRNPRHSGIFTIFNNRKFEIIIGTDEKWETVELNIGGAVLEGLIKSDKILINGGGINIKSLIETEVLDLDGAGLKVDLKIRNTEKVYIDGAGLNAKIKYLDIWSGRRFMEVNGVGSNLIVSVPECEGEDIDGKLDINTGGFVNVDVKHYHKN